MSMRIVPAAAHSSSRSQTAGASLGAPSAPGVHDTLRSGVGPTPITSSFVTTSSTNTTPLDSAHPLEARLAQWTTTQDALKLEGLRRTFGMAEPIRRGMELKIARDGEWRPACLGSNRPSVHEDILSGRDTMCGWEDVFDGSEMRASVGFHEEVEKRVGMGL